MVVVILCVHGFRVHLQQRIEDDHHCRLLVNEMKNLLTLTYSDQIQEQEVLDHNYILRVLHMRKVDAHVYTNTHTVSRQSN